jgi:hypothetical protein
MNLIKFKKKNKAQLFSLDIVFALIIIILLLFLLSKIAEVKIYKINTNNNLKELDLVGNSTYKKLVSNPKLNCYVYDANNHFLLSNCIGNDSAITKANLDIPDSYKCNITGLPGGINNDCDDVGMPVDNVYKINFTIDYYNNTRNIPKNIYINGLLNLPLSFTNHDVTLNVWKDE